MSCSSRLRNELCNSGYNFNNARDYRVCRFTTDKKMLRRWHSHNLARRLYAVDFIIKAPVATEFEASIQKDIEVVAKVLRYKSGSRTERGKWEIVETINTVCRDYQELRQWCEEMCDCYNPY